MASSANFTRHRHKTTLFFLIMEKNEIAGPSFLTMFSLPKGSNLKHLVEKQYGTLFLRKKDSNHFELNSNMQRGT